MTSMTTATNIPPALPADRRQGWVGLSIFAGASLALALCGLILVATIVYGLMIKPLPFAEDDRLVFVGVEDLAAPVRSTSSATFVDWDEGSTSFEMLSALAPTSLTMRYGEVQKTHFSRRVTADYFPLFGVEPLLGRAFSVEEERRGAKVALLSHWLWQSSFGGEEGIVGRSVELDGETYQILGVVDFQSPLEPSPIGFWIPLALTPESLQSNRRWLFLWGRLAESVTLEDAREELTVRLEARAGPESPALKGRVATLHGVRDDYVADFGPFLAPLAAAAVLLFLIAAVHAATLLGGRSRVSIPVARRVGGLVLTAATVAGGVMAAAVLPSVKASVPDRFGPPQLCVVTIDLLVIVAILGVVLLLGTLWPTLVRTAADRRGRLFLLAAVLLAAAPLFAIAAQSAAKAIALSRDAPGRDLRHVLTLRTSLRGPDYRAAARRVEQIERRRQVLAALPEIRAVGATDLIPLGKPLTGALFSIGDAATASFHSASRSLLQVITPGYFEALGIEILEGQSFSGADQATTLPVAVVNGLFVERYLTGRSPIGQKLSFAGDPPETREIVGVVEDIRTYATITEPVPTVYVPHAQKPVPIMTFVSRTEGDPMTASSSVIETLSELDPKLPIYAVTSLDSTRREVDWSARSSARLLVTMAALGLLLVSTSTGVVLVRRPDMEVSAER